LVARQADASSVTRYLRSRDGVLVKYEARVQESHVTRTTPPRPVDVTAIVPDISPLARTALRLHPRRGKPAFTDSSVGGPLSWPADEPWPTCDRQHFSEEPPTTIFRVRRARELEQLARSRALTSEELAELLTAKQPLTEYNPAPVTGDPTTVLPIIASLFVARGSARFLAVVVALSTRNLARRAAALKVLECLEHKGRNR